MVKALLAKIILARFDRGSKIVHNATKWHPTRMDNNLTLSTLSFVLAAPTADGGSTRRETSRGLQLPTIMTIKHRTVLDSKTKKPVQQDLLQFDYVKLLSDGSYAPVRVKLTAEIPVDSGVAGSDVLAAIELVSQVIQEDDSGINIPDKIFVNKEQ